MAPFEFSCTLSGGPTNDYAKTSQKPLLTDTLFIFSLCNKVRDKKMQLIKSNRYKLLHTYNVTYTLWSDLKSLKRGDD